jgi:phosphoadenosine phosphosulfate reductase
MTRVLHEQFDLEALNAVFAGYEPARMVEWAAHAFGPEQLVMSSSFGADSAVLLHLATRVVPDLHVIFIDTGYLFAETHAFMEQLRARLGLNVITYRPLHDPLAWLRQNNETNLTQRNNVEACCAANKNEPFDRAMHELAPRAWLRGIRRDQAATRAKRSIVEWSDRFHCYAISPLLNWTSRQIHAYLKQHELPYHPLVEKGYFSIGCSPITCTRPITPGEDARTGRWSGQNKTECGLHL